MKIGILQFGSNSFPPFFYEWIKTLVSHKEHSFVWIGNGSKKVVPDCDFIKMPFRLSFGLAKSTHFEAFFLQHQLDICFVPEDFKTDIEGYLLIFVTAKGLIFKNKEKLKKIKQKKHLIITPFSFFNPDKTADNVFTIYPNLPLLKEGKDMPAAIAKAITTASNYLLCYSQKPNFDDVIFLLKAFSVFKKQQKTQMQLVLLWKKIHPSIAHKLSEYKYKNDIVLIESETAPAIFTQMISKAYAYVFPFAEEINLVEEQLFSLSKQTPIIAIDNPYAREIIGNAGMVISRKNVAELAEALKKIYLEERLKKQFAQNATQQYQQLSFDYNLKKINELLPQQLEIYKKYYFKTPQ